MDSQELLLAAAVRDIALELRKRAAALAAKTEQRTGDETFDAFHGRFAKAHPLTEYAKPALQELEAIAAAMRQ